MLSENLRRIRLEQRYTRKALEEKTRISATTIQAIENGENSNPKLNTVLELAKALKVSITTLLK